jgi:hypothetical protein
VQDRFYPSIVWSIVTISPALGQSLALNCTPANATRHDYKDPVVKIRMQVNEHAVSIIHEAQRGASYDGATPYLATLTEWRGRNFVWMGRSYKSPALRMKGSVEVTPNGYS